MQAQARQPDPGPSDAAALLEEREIRLKAILEEKRKEVSAAALRARIKVRALLKLGGLVPMNLCQSHSDKERSDLVAAVLGCCILPAYLDGLRPRHQGWRVLAC